LIAAPQRSIGEAILDQRNLAGIGNVYKSEALFLCRINPWTPVADVVDLQKLLETARRLLLTNRQSSRRSTTGSRRHGEEYWVYLRHNRPCRRCGTLIVSAAQGERGQERGTFWCPRCQPA
jgi:endonuclease-8